MKTFFIKIFFFSLFLLIWFMLNFIINFYIIKNTNPDIKSTNILITGDSHTYNGISPYKFKSAQNISQLAESYVLSYWKLKKIFSFAKPDTLIIAFAPHNISELDDVRFASSSWANVMFTRSYMIQEFKYLNSVRVDYKKLSFVYFKNMCLLPKKHHNNYIGEYAPSSVNRIGNFDKTIASHYGNGSYKFSKTSMQYLDSILNLCKKKGIKLILVNTPVHKNYYNSIPEKFKKKYRQEAERLKKQGAIVIDMSNLVLPDEYYVDDDHLNTKGANYYTNTLVEYLKNK